MGNHFETCARQRPRLVDRRPFLYLSNPMHLNRLYNQNGIALLIALTVTTILISVALA